jgi:hypothetical protein
MRFSSQDELCTFGEFSTPSSYFPFDRRFAGGVNWLASSFAWFQWGYWKGVKKVFQPSPNKKGGSDGD